MSNLYKIVAWTKENGDERASARLKMLSLSHLIKDNIKFDEIRSDTQCSDECLASIRAAAEQITKQKCPH